MLLKELGRSGVMLPEVGIGTWNHRGGAELLKLGLESGASFIDTAESYGSEEVVGAAVKGIRDRVFIATKVSPGNFKPADFRVALDRSLLRLGVDYVDLLQLHQPSPTIPIDETMGAMADALKGGKVRFAGVSNFSLTQLREAQVALGSHPIVSNQLRYNLIDRTIEADLLRYCDSNHITVIAYSPLAKGLHRILDCDPEGVIREVSGATGKSPAQVVLNWCLSKPPVVVIPAANSQEHVLDNCGASGWHLSDEQLVLLSSKVQFRHRSRMDGMIRKLIPHSLEGLAIRVRDSLPRSIRRRLT